MTIDYSNYKIRTNQMEEKGATAHWFVQRYIWSKTWREDQKALKPSKLPTPIVATSLQRMVLELNYMPGPPEKLLIKISWQLIVCQDRPKNY